MANTSDIKNGLCIVLKGNIFSIVEFQHVKPGKGPAFVRTKLKNLKTGKVLDNTFPAGHKIETARVERRKFQFLYKDSNGFNFMNQETYDQISLEEERLTSADLLKESEIVEILYHAETEEILTCEMPTNVTLEVTYAEPGVKGDTATNATKPATLETGAKVNVPLFVNEGDVIKVDTKSRSYIERVKN